MSFSGRFRPGGFGFLLAHELYLWRRVSPLSRKILPLVIMLAVPVVCGVGLAVLLAHVPDGKLSPRRAHAVTVFISLGLAANFLLMLPSAATGALRVFHDRGDLDLLLSAPVPAARVLAAKTVGLYLSVAALSLGLFGPFLLARAVLGHPGALGAFVVLLALAAVAVALAFAAARALGRWLGATRARTIVQVLAGVLGAFVFLAFQLNNFAPESAHAIGRALVGAAMPAPLDWPARAAMGAPGPLLAMLALGLAAAWASAGIAARLVADPPADRARRAAPAGPVRFAHGLTRVLVIKELRLVARDPELVASVTLRLVFLIPVVALVFRGGAAGFDPARLASAATFFAGFLASSLAWITVCAEDAPDLVAAAPVRSQPVLRAKLIAACVPPVALALVPALVAARFSPWAGFVAAMFAAAAAAAAGALQAWYGKPAPRKTFKTRQRGSFALGLAELALTTLMGATALLVARLSPLALLPGLLAAAIVYAAAEGRGTGPRAATSSG